MIVCPQEVAFALDLCLRPKTRNKRRQRGTMPDKDRDSGTPGDLGNLILVERNFVSEQGNYWAEYGGGGVSS